MNMLLWDADASGNRFAMDDYGQIPLTEKPIVSLIYNSLRYVATGEMWYTDSDGIQQVLPANVISEIMLLISDLRDAYGIYVHAVDTNGKYLGYLLNTDSSIVSTVPYPPPSSDIWRWTDSTWSQVWPVDTNGKVCADDATAKAIITTPPTTHKNTWSFTDNEWVDPVATVSAVRSGCMTILHQLYGPVYSSLTTTADLETFSTKLFTALQTVINSDTAYSGVANVSDFLTKAPTAIEDLCEHSDSTDDVDVVLKSFMTTTTTTTS